ncbi:SusD/RagB family nutrient-binding outer membrane lipoprotein [Bacteroides sp. f07]
MNMEIFKYLNLKSLFCLGAVVLLTSCTNNFEELNTNPDEVTDEMANRDNAKNGSFFLQMQENVIPIFESSDYQVIEVMTGDGFVGYYGSPDPNINSAGRYSWSGNSNWPGSMFTRAYKDVMNPWRELRKAINNENDPRYAVVQILKVATMHRVTDSYGPIPYLKFGIEKEVMYDAQKDVYYRFFEELDAAVRVLDSYATNGDKVFSDWDCVYNGNVKSWVKFANTLRFRLAMHLSDVDADKAKTEIKAAIEAPHGFVESKGDIAELQHVHPIATYESPWYVIKGWGDIAMGATLDSYMNGYEDPRREVYFVTASDGKYRGIRAGLPKEVSKDSYTKDGLFSQPNVTATSNVVWMRAAEIFFLKAEAALRWPELELGGTAQKFYEDGIRKSFEEHGVSGAENYLSDDVLKPASYKDPVTSSYSAEPLGSLTIKWAEGDSPAKKLERIITQKYIALYPVGQEAWTDFRRTGYPKVFPVISNESAGGCVSTNTQIRRLPYPRSEYDTNQKAVLEGVKLLQGPDNAGTRVWWD